MWQRASTTGSASASDEQTIVRRALAGDDDAFADLFHRYCQDVHRVACAILKDQALALDVVQETFLKVHRSLSQWKGEASLRTWIVRTAVRTAIDARRGVARRREVVPGAEPAHDPRQRLERVLMLARVRELAESVDGQQGVILRLRLFGGLTNKEVAASLGLTESNVRAQLTNAVRLLRRGL